MVPGSIGQDCEEGAVSETQTDTVALLRELLGEPRSLTPDEIEQIIDEVESLRSTLESLVAYLEGAAYRRDISLKQQAMARAFLKTGLKYRDTQMLQSAQSLLTPKQLTDREGEQKGQP